MNNGGSFGVRFLTKIYRRQEKKRNMRSEK